MDDEIAAKHFDGIVRELGAAYALITAVLAAMPIPMRLPRSQAPDPAAAIHALNRAWELAELEPLSPVEIARTRAMISDWLAAYELACRTDRTAPASWRLRSMDLCLMRARAEARHLKQYVKWAKGLTSRRPGPFPVPGEPRPR
jgi:hypothetical protein